ncbi:MAG: hypothetical protein FWE70_02155 [Oscillospiraceae bacterium]|nr:hypothetical protein [Oscillospiraceae bacterium]
MGAYQSGSAALRVEDGGWPNGAGRAYGDAPSGRHGGHAAVCADVPDGPGDGPTYWTDYYRGLIERRDAVGRGAAAVVRPDMGGPVGRAHEGAPTWRNGALAAVQGGMGGGPVDGADYWTELHKDKIERRNAISHGAAGIGRSVRAGGADAVPGAAEGSVGRSKGGRTGAGPGMGGPEAKAESPVTLALDEGERERIIKGIREGSEYYKEKAMRKVRRKGRAFLVLLLIVAIMGYTLILIMENQQMDISYEIKRGERALAELVEENGFLSSEIERRKDIYEAKAQAEGRLGMQKPDKSQVRVINVPHKDQTVILEVGEARLGIMDGIIGSILSFIS